MIGLFITLCCHPTLIFSGITFLYRLICALITDLGYWCLSSPKQMFDRTVVITGAAGPVGYALGKRFLKMGASVMLIDPNPEIETMAEHLNRAYREPNAENVAYGLICDCCSTNELKAIAANLNNTPLRSRFGIDAVICCCGTMHVGSVLDLNDEQFTESMETNVRSVFAAIQAFIPHMVKQNRGQIVAVGSVAGNCGQTLAATYSSSQFAIKGLMESLRWEISDRRWYGLRATVLYPYFTDESLMPSVYKLSSRLFKPLNFDQTIDRMTKCILYEYDQAYIPGYAFVLGDIVKNLMPYSALSVIRDYLGLCCTNLDIFTSYIKYPGSNGMKVFDKKTLELFIQNPITSETQPTLKLRHELIKDMTSSSIQSKAGAVSFITNNDCCLLNGSFSNGVNMNKDNCKDEDGANTATNENSETSRVVDTVLCDHRDRDRQTGSYMDNDGWKTLLEDKNTSPTSAESDDQTTDQSEDQVQDKSMNQSLNQSITQLEDQSTPCASISSDVE